MSISDLEDCISDRLKLLYEIDSEIVRLKNAIQSREKRIEYRLKRGLDVTCSYYYRNLNKYEYETRLETALAKFDDLSNEIEWLEKLSKGEQCEPLHLYSKNSVNMNNAVRNALKQINSSLDSNKMYRILDKNGLVYSQSLGWVELNNDTYGHIFSEKELPIVLSVLKEHGYTEIRTELDKVGTMFIAAAESPFGNPSKMVHLVIYTILFFVLLFIVLNTGLFSTLTDLLTNTINNE